MSVTGFNRRRRMIADMRAKAEKEVRAKETKNKKKQTSKKKTNEGAE
ncbi:MAG: hypothetical protein ACFWTN_07625 [Clostridium sp.]|jgi:hypothetical protein